jgi:hypothetical protein
MPPSWRGAGIRHPVCGFGGEHVGHLLPGRGLYVDMDLKSLGVTRPIPHVLERSPMRRAIDLLLDSSGAITSAAGVTKAQQQAASYFVAVGGTLGGGTYWIDHFPLPNSQGVSSLFPTPVATMDQTTPGAMSTSLFAPSGSNSAYLVSFGVNCTGASAPTFPNGYACFMLVDFLAGLTGLTTNSVASQTIATPALSRYTSGAGVMALLEYWGSGVTPPTAGTGITLSYHNQANAPASATSIIANMSLAGSIAAVSSETLDTLPFHPLAAGDYGIRSMDSVQFGAATGAGANLQAALYFPLMIVCGTQNVDDYFEVDLPSRIEGLIPLPTSSGTGTLGCFGVLGDQLNQANTSPQNIIFTFRVIQG